MKSFSKLEKVVIFSLLGFAVLFMIGFFLFWFVISRAVSM